MEDITTIGEILEFAIAREAEAVNFYMAMAERVNDPSVQEFFENLVSEEMEHKSRLELEMMKEGLVAETVGILPETTGGGVVVNPAQVKEHLTYAEALTIAVQKERRSFRLYVRLSGMVGDDEFREVLICLAEEEARHMAALEEQYNNATKEQR